MMSLVSQHGIKHWAIIAKHLKGRTGKQCRERYLIVCVFFSSDQVWAAPSRYVLFPE